MAHDGSKDSKEEAVQETGSCSVKTSVPSSQDSALVQATACGAR